MRVAYVGNFGAPHSTENEIRKAWGALGVEVLPIQEETTRWASLPDRVTSCDLVMWTRTADLDRDPDADKRRALDVFRERGVPTVAYHLDRWWGLKRENSVRTEAFFRCEYVCTADGGHDDQFADLGINHRWFPPAISEFETEPGTPSDQWRSDLAFVGSWQHGYHAEWTHRMALVDWLRANYGDCRFWPEPGRPAVRGDALRDLYASIEIAVGDSCLSGGATRYWSDRIPETLGRGAFLIHPYVTGIAEHFTPGQHLVTWEHGDFDTLRTLIGIYLNDDAERSRIAAAGRQHVLENHTYTVRMRQVLDLVGLS